VIVASIGDAIQPGSYLALSHVTGDIRRESAASAAVHYKKVTSGATLRGREEILRFFAGLELIEPELVQVPRWRPDEPVPADADKVWILGGVARKPGPPWPERL
jgi:S-adenosyl methyltransferase